MCAPKPVEAEIEQSLARGAEQDRVETSGACRTRALRMLRDGEDDVEVGNVEDFFAPRLEPLLPRLAATPGTVTVAARVPEDVLVAAGVTTVAMTAQGGRAAVGDGAHHLALGGAHGELARRSPPLARTIAPSESLGAHRAITRSFDGGAIASRGLRA